MNHPLNLGLIKKLPIDHFGYISQDILNKLTNGECCSVYGIPGYGKNFFKKHINFLLALNHPEISIVHLNLEIDRKKIEALNSRISKVISTKKFNPEKFTAHLKNHKIIVIINELNSLNYKSFFKQLITLRSFNRENFTVLSLANFSIQKCIDSHTEEGKGLFNKPILIRNFNLEGTIRMIELNNEEHNWKIPQSYARQILLLSGGNPALVKNITMLMYEKGLEIIDNIDKLIATQPLNEKLGNLAKLFIRLTIDDQINIGLLNNNGSIFSKLLSEYISNFELEGLNVLFPKLTKTDRKIFSVFIQNQGRVINKEQFSLFLDQSIEASSQWAIYKAVERLKGKIKDRYIIKTVKGKGWRMGEEK